jgi:hypothetical protein
MDQLTLSFHDEFLLQLKTTDWEFESKPGDIEKSTSHSKFIQLDQGISDKKAINTDKNTSSKSNN